MPTWDRIVIDTNVFVSAIMLPSSPPRQAVDRALDVGVLLFSDDTLSELSEVLSRRKFDDYVSLEERLLFLNRLTVTAEFVSTIQKVRECRDARDDKFLEVALDGRAHLIITGDADLLTLNPWREIEIVTPGEYLTR